MTAGQFFSYLLFILASIPLIAFLATVIIRIYFTEKSKWLATAANAIAKKLEEMKEARGDNNG